MNVSCPECRSVFRVDPSKLPSTTVRARCSVCGGVITITPGSSIEDEFSGTASPARVATRIESEAPASRGNAGLSTALLDTLSAPPVPPRSPTPAHSTGAVTPAAPVRGPVAPNTEQSVSRPLNPPPGNPPIGVRPVLFPPRPMMPGGAGALSAGSGMTARPIAPRPAAAPAPHPMPVSPAVPAPRPNNVGAAAALPPSAPASAPPSARPAGTGASAPTPAPNAPTRSPINPFLANDPHAKAKRLARALVSDLVTYFPQKRQDGLRDGTLKQLFKDEIQKSYEEYVSQIGREFAESTPHFQEALNDILAGGQKVF